MQRVLSRTQVRDFDRRATDLYQVPSLLLMENAGRGAVEEIVALYGGRLPPGLEVVVVCGAGNNAGDGYVVARRLTLLGADVQVVALADRDRLRGDALVNHDAFRGIGGRILAVSPGNGAADLGEDSAVVQLLAGAKLIVDALLGTGVDREVVGLARELIERVNAAPARKVALDLPSGLDADSGAVHGVSVHAELTVTFAAHKLGLLTPSGLRQAGRVVVKDIGVPLSERDGVGQSAWLIEGADVARALPRRSPSAHKVSSGRVLVLAGSRGKTGAALLVARGALRAGAGLVTIASWPDAMPAIASRVLEAMTAELDPEQLSRTLDPLLEAADVVAIGPGFGLDEAARTVVERVLLRHAGTIVADADALTHFAGRLPALRESSRLVLTPHPGELGRMLGSDAKAVEADRFTALARAVEESGATVLLKGPHTLIGTPDEAPRVGPASTPALATGGAGDVLCGVIAGLCCSVEPFVAAWAGVYVHGLSAAEWAAQYGADRGLLASEVADRIPRVLAELSGGRGSLTD
jgi:NAD(P)H-hydrate epimerase